MSEIAKPLLPASRTRAIVLIDGEHHPSAVADALAEVARDREIESVVFCGGGEKVPPEVLAAPEDSYGHPLVFGDDPCDALGRALADGEAGVVVDLADEPVVPLAEKLRLAALAMSRGLAYEAPGMSLQEPRLDDLGYAGPVISIIGTGKRTGKTAVCGHLAALIGSVGGSPAIVSMGRGGPPTPQVARPSTGLQELISLSRQGIHAASDYLEDAVLAGVPSVGCRRVGGGPGGAAAYTNFHEGARIAAALDDVDCLLLEGSGASLPPVRSDSTICIAGTLEQATTLAGPLRLLGADLVLVPAGDQALRAAAGRWTTGEIVPFELRPTTAVAPPAGARVAFFSTGAGELSDVEPVFKSANLARRELLAEDLERAARENCTHYATELKAAAIDMVATHAESCDASVVFVHNKPVGTDGYDLDSILLNIYDRAAKHATAAQGNRHDGP